VLTKFRALKVLGMNCELKHVSAAY